MEFIRYDYEPIGSEISSHAKFPNFANPRIVHLGDQDRRKDAQDEDTTNDVYLRTSGSKSGRKAARTHAADGTSIDWPSNSI